MTSTCHECGRPFDQKYPHHVCFHDNVAPFLQVKPEIALKLFQVLLHKFEEIGPSELYATKSMLQFKNKRSFAQVIYFGKTFIDVVFQFKERFDENLCFRKIAPVPGTSDFNHHIRLMYPEDLNEEVFAYMKKAYYVGKKL